MRKSQRKILVSIAFKLLTGIFPTDHVVLVEGVYVRSQSVFNPIEIVSSKCLVGDKSETTSTCFVDL